MDKIEKLVLEYILYNNLTKEDFDKLSKEEKEKFIELVKHHSVVKPQQKERRIKNEVSNL